MSALIIAYVLINTLAAATTCWYALCGLNACTRKTPPLVRVSFAAIAIGAFAALLNPPDIDAAGGAPLLVMAGIAVGFVVNRRQCVCLNCPARGKRKPAPMDHRESGGHPA